VWVTEFGWDATTKPAPKTGDFAKWDGNVSDQKQAQYLVRAFLVFAAMDVERAYLYFFNDSDEPSFHASSGITRNFEPKPAFRALAHLYRSLGDYRFSRVMEKEDGEIYVYEFVHGTQPKNKIVVAWSPTGAGRSAEVDLPVGTSRVVRAEKMPVAAGDAPPVRFNAQAGAVRFTLEESPIYFWIAEH
jgi:serine/threonine-protein kinase ATR